MDLKIEWGYHQESTLWSHFTQWLFKSITIFRNMKQYQSCFIWCGYAESLSWPIVHLCSDRCDHTYTFPSSLLHLHSSSLHLWLSSPSWRLRHPPLPCALLMQCTCQEHAGVLHNDSRGSVTVHSGVILHALMILHVTRRHRPVKLRMISHQRRAHYCGWGVCVRKRPPGTSWLGLLFTISVSVWPKTEEHWHIAVLISNHI